MNTSNITQTGSGQVNYVSNTSDFTISYEGKILNHLPTLPTSRSVIIDVINKSRYDLPTYQSVGAAALDILSNNEENVVIKPGKHALIKTGLFMAIPMGFALRLTGRSGLAFKANIEVHPGVIDSDYRGELGVVVHNFLDEDFVVEPGMRICQAYVEEVIKIVWNQVGVLPTTERGSGGFGSTGLK